MVNFYMKMEIFMKENGLMINNVVKEKQYIKMVILIKVNLKIIKKMDQVHIFGMNWMKNILEIGLMIKSKVMVNIHGSK